jgi:hypothetical protein
MFSHEPRDTAFKCSLKQVLLATEAPIRPAASSFNLHKNRAKPAVFLAGGIGITPFLSIARQAHHDRLPHKLYLSIPIGSLTFPGHSAEPGEDESRLPLDLHHDRNVEIQGGMEK